MSPREIVKGRERLIREGRIETDGIRGIGKKNRWKEEKIEGRKSLQTQWTERGIIIGVVNGAERRGPMTRRRDDDPVGSSGGKKERRAWQDENRTVRRAWNSPFLTGLCGATRIVRLGIGARKQDHGAGSSQTYRCYAIHSVFLSIGIRDLHSGPVTISIDARVKTDHGSPPLIKGERPRDRRASPRQRIRG